MYKIIKRLHLLECECCGDIQVVDDEMLVDMLLDGNITTGEPFEIEDDCDGNCENCSIEH